MNKSRMVLRQILEAAFSTVNREMRQPAAALGWLALSFMLLVSLPVQAVAQSEDATGATAPQKEPRHEQREYRRNEGLMERLNLSPDQRAQIRTIRMMTNTQGLQIAERLRTARRALDEAIYLENADESVVEARVRDVAAAQAASVRLRALTEIEIRRLLTPEQLNTLREIRREAAARQQERRSRGQERRMRRGFNRSRRLDPDAPADNPAIPQPTAEPRPRRDPPPEPRP